MGYRRAAIVLALVSAMGCAGRAQDPAARARAPRPAGVLDGASLVHRGEDRAWRPVETPWCTGRWVGLDEGTCYYVPTSLGQAPWVVYFLHAMLAPTDSPAALQAVAAEAAESLGFVAVFPRGRQGLCTWSASVADWWCWPATRDAVDSEGQRILDAWRSSEALLEKILGVSFDRRYVMGFSNGGYFASYIGLEQRLPVDGIGIVAAGRMQIDKKLMAPRQLPFYIAVGELDQASVKVSAQSLALVLAMNRWPVAFVQHTGRGHEIYPDDFRSAWSVWKRAAARE